MALWRVGMLGSTKYSHGFWVALNYLVCGFDIGS